MSAGAGIPSRCGRGLGLTPEPVAMARAWAGRACRVHAGERGGRRWRGGWTESVDQGLMTGGAG